MAALGIKGLSGSFGAIAWARLLADGNRRSGLDVILLDPGNFIHQLPSQVDRQRIDLEAGLLSWRMSAASLPMYDLPEVRPALAALWAGLARHLAREGIADVPAALACDQPVAALWRRPDLLFSQCCGYDLVNAYAGALRPLATPCYRAPGCAGPSYRSIVVVAEDSAGRELEDLRGGVCAINGRTRIRA